MRVAVGILIASMTAAGIILGGVNPPSLQNECQECGAISLMTSRQRWPGERRFVSLSRSSWDHSRSTVQEKASSSCSRWVQRERGTS